jgi:membrane protease YdiL (CAAX protease family)
LFGLFLNHYNAITAIIASAIIFGLWHIFPTINSLERNQMIAEKMKGKKSRKTGAVMGTVIVTGVAGLIFGWLRLIAGSIIAPWLVHWSINASGVLGVAVARKLENNKPDKLN